MKIAFIDGSPAERDRLAEALQKLTADQAPVEILDGDALSARARQLSYKNQLHGILTRISEAIVRVRDVDALYAEACRIATTGGLFRMAWVGVVDDAAGILKPVAWAGCEEGYLQRIRVSVADDAEGRGPSGSAIREGRHFVCDDFEHDPRMGPWRAEALSHGYRSSAAFPLSIDGQPFGALTLYGSAPYLFDADAVDLLTTLAADISFAVHTAEAERKRREAEERLQRANDELECRVAERTSALRAIVSTMVEGLMVFDLDGNLVEMNAAVRRLYGIAQDAPLPTRLSDVLSAVHIEDLDGHPLPPDAFPARRVLRGEVYSDYRLCVRLLNGEREWIASYSGSLVRDAEGRPVLGLVTLHDMTDEYTATQDRERLLAQVRQQAAFLETVLRQAADAILAVDTSGTLLLVNAAARRLARLDPEGKDLDLVFDAWGEVQDAAGRALLPSEAGLRRALAGETIRGIEHRLVQPDGTARDILFSAAPVRDPAGRALGGVVVFSDITARKQAERERERLLVEAHERTIALSEANRRAQEQAEEVEVQAEELRLQNEQLLTAYQALADERSLRDAVLEQMAGGVMVAEAPSGRAIYANRRVFEIMRAGYEVPRSLAEYLRFEAFYPNGSRWPADRAPLLRSVGGETIDNEEMVVVRGDGTRAVLSINGRPVRDTRGQIVAGVVTFDDITQRKEMEKALRTAHDELDGRVRARTAELAAANVRLEEHAAQLRVLHEIDLSVLSTLSTEAIARLATEHVRRAVPCLRASVILFDPDASQARILAAHSDELARPAAGAVLPLPKWRQAAELDAGRIADVEDLGAAGELNALEAELRDQGARSYTIFPLVAGARTIGALDLWRSQPGRLPSEQREVARQVADSLAVAIQNARLLEQVRRSRDQLQQLSRRLVEVQENERRAIARELHDEAGQSLTGLKLSLGFVARDPDCPPSLAERIEEQRRTIDEVLEGLHRLSVDLRPASLDRLGLVAAVSQYAQSFRRQSGLEVDVVAVGLEDPREQSSGALRLPAEIETTLYRVVQEAMTNVARHAHARRVGVILERKPARVLAIVEDDGQGFDVANALARGRLGLVGMSERVEMLGGKITIESSPGSGTTVFAEVPLADSE